MISGSFQTNRLINYSQHNNSPNQNLNPTNNMLLTSNGNLNSTILNQTNTNQYSPNTSETFLQNQNPSLNSIITNVGCCYRPDIISKLQKEYSLISMITTNLANYYENVRKLTQTNVEYFDPETILADGRFNHITQIQERLNFMKYLLKEGT